jgi:hypothetical protein
MLVAAKNVIGGRAPAGQIHLFRAAASPRSPNGFVGLRNSYQLEIPYAMTGSKNWEGVWSGTKRWNRVSDADVQQVVCVPDPNDHLPSATSEMQVR